MKTLPSMFQATVALKGGRSTSTSSEKGASAFSRLVQDNKTGKAGIITKAHEPSALASGADILPRGLQAKRQESQSASTVDKIDPANDVGLEDQGPKDRHHAAADATSLTVTDDLASVSVLLQPAPAAVMGPRADQGSAGIVQPVDDGDTPSNTGTFAPVKPIDSPSSGNTTQAAAARATATVRKEQSAEPAMPPSGRDGPQQRTAQQSTLSVEGSPPCISERAVHGRDVDMGTSYRHSTNSPTTARDDRVGPDRRLDVAGDAPRNDDETRQSKGPIASKRPETPPGTQDPNAEQGDTARPPERIVPERIVAQPPIKSSVSAAASSVAEPKRLVPEQMVAQPPTKSPVSAAASNLAKPERVTDRSPAAGMSGIRTEMPEDRISPLQRSEILDAPYPKGGQLASPPSAHPILDSAPSPQLKVGPDAGQTSARKPQPVPEIRDPRPAADTAKSVSTGPVTDAMSNISRIPTVRSIAVIRPAFDARPVQPLAEAKLQPQPPAEAMSAPQALPDRQKTSPFSFATEITMAAARYKLPDGDTGEAGASPARLPKSDHMAKAADAPEADQPNRLAMAEPTGSDPDAPVKGSDRRAEATSQAMPSREPAGRSPGDLQDAPEKSRPVPTVIGNSPSASTAATMPLTTGLAPSPASTVATVISSEPSWRPKAVALSTQLGSDRAGTSPETLSIQLNPGNIGVVTATLSMSGTQIKVHLAAETSQAHERLKADSHTIERAMHALGYEASDVTISQSLIVQPLVAKPDVSSPATAPSTGSQPSFDAKGSAGEHRSTGQNGDRQGNGRTPNAAGFASRPPDADRGGVYI